MLEVQARHPEMMRSVGSGPLLEPGSHQALYGYGCTTHKHKFQEERGEPFADMNQTLAGAYAHVGGARPRLVARCTQDSPCDARQSVRPGGVGAGLADAVLIVRNPYDWLTAFYRFPWDTIYPPFVDIPLGGRRRRGAVRAAVRGRHGPAQLRRAVSYQPQRATSRIHHAGRRRLSAQPPLVDGAATVAARSMITRRDVSLEAFATMPWNTSVDKHAGDAPHRNLPDMRTRKLLRYVARSRRRKNDISIHKRHTRP